MEIKSILNQIVGEINNTEDIEVIKNIFVKRVSESKINEKDKRKMLNIIRLQDTYKKVISYIYNCLLKYEGCGVCR